MLDGIRLVLLLAQSQYLLSWQWVSDLAMPWDPSRFLVFWQQHQYVNRGGTNLRFICSV